MMTILVGLLFFVALAPLTYGCGRVANKLVEPAYLYDCEEWHDHLISGAIVLVLLGMLLLFAYLVGALVLGVLS